MKKQLLLIGGGHAHLVSLANIRLFVEKGYGVTVVQPSEFHYYSGMGPGVLGGTYQADDIRFNTRKTVESSGGRFVLDKVTSIDPYNQCIVLKENNEKIQYDVLSCNTGSYVPQAIAVAEGCNVVIPAKPIEALLVGKHQVLALPRDNKKTVAVIGSGPSAIEIAGNLCLLCKKHSHDMVSVRLFAGRHFMRNHPRRLRTLARRLLERKGVAIIDGSYVAEISQENLLLENGEQHRADIIFTAVGVQPSSLFRRSELPVGPDGGLRVNEYLQSTAYDNIFGGGDCIFFENEPLARVGVYAVRQGPVLHDNLMCRLDETALKKFTPQRDFLRIYNLGERQSLLSIKGVMFSGMLAFLIKDYIDRRFIARFS